MSSEQPPPRPVPSAKDPSSAISQFEAFEELVRVLRSDCPWDRKQTNESLGHLMVEEVYEVVDAVADGNDAELKKELGDVLLHIVMHSVIAEQRGAFSLRDVIESVIEKLVRRHPHVFGDVVANDEGEVKANWERIKMQEGRTSVLEGVPKHAPSLLRAQRMQEKAARVGFDWPAAEGAWEKVREELAELQQELQNGSAAAAEEEFGDLLFALVNTARFAGIVAEDALQKANAKFLSRFRHIETQAQAAGRTLHTMTLEEMDALWDEAKQQERSTAKEKRD